MARRDAWTWLVAPLLLVVVALVQFRNVIVDDESTWSGAGFGMFATFDNEPTRVVRSFVTLDGAEFEVPASALGERTQELRTLPSESELRAAADELLEKEWAITDGIAQAVDDGQTATAARVAVVGLRLSGPADRPVVSTMPIRAVEVEAT